MRQIIVVAGPTAVGKTKYAIEIAKAFNGEVVYRCGKCNLLYYADGSNVTLQKLSLISLPNKVSYRTEADFNEYSCD